MDYGPNELRDVIDEQLIEVSLDISGDIDLSMVETRREK